VRGAIRSTVQSRRSLDLLSRIEASCFNSMKTELTAEYVREALDYNPATGDLVWKERPIWHFKNRTAMTSWNNKYVGLSAGTPVNTSRKNQANYYLSIRIDKRRYLVHRIIWLHVHGTLPDSQIDHINNCRKDNRLANLREATASQNQHNSPLQRNNTSGLKGVYFDKRKKEWVGRIYLKRKIAWSARRKNLDKLVSDLVLAREGIHQEFKNHG